MPTYNSKRDSVQYSNSRDPYDQQEDAARRPLQAYSARPSAQQQNPAASYGSPFLDAAARRTKNVDSRISAYRPYGSNSPTSSRSMADCSEHFQGKNPPSIQHDVFNRIGLAAEHYDSSEYGNAQRSQGQVVDARPSTAAGLASLREAPDVSHGRPATTGNVGAPDGGLGTRQSVPQAHQQEGISHASVLHARHSMAASPSASPSRYHSQSASRSIITGSHAGDYSNSSRPYGLPPPSPTRSKAANHLLFRSNSAKHDQHMSSLLSSLTVQQLSGANSPTPSSPQATKTTNNSSLYYSPQVIRTSQTRPSTVHHSTAESSARQHGNSSQSASKGRAGTPSKDTSKNTDDYTLQRRFSTGSVSGQAWQQSSGTGPPAHTSNGGHNQYQSHNAGQSHHTGSSAQLAETWGTLTCVRQSSSAYNNSNFAVAFAAESQQEIGDQQYGSGNVRVNSATAARQSIMAAVNEEPVSPAAQSWTRHTHAFSHGSASSPTQHKASAGYGHPSGTVRASSASSSPSKVTVKRPSSSTAATKQTDIHHGYPPSPGRLQPAQYGSMHSSQQQQDMSVYSVDSMGQSVGKGITTAKSVDVKPKAGSVSRSSGIVDQCQQSSMEQVRSRDSTSSTDTRPSPRAPAAYQPPSPSKPPAEPTSHQTPQTLHHTSTSQHVQHVAHHQPVPQPNQNTASGYAQRPASADAFTSQAAAHQPYQQQSSNNSMQVGKSAAGGTTSKTAWVSSAVPSSTTAAGSAVTSTTTTAARTNSSQQPQSQPQGYASSQTSTGPVHYPADSRYSIQQHLQEQAVVSTHVGSESIRTPVGFTIQTAQPTSQQPQQSAAATSATTDSAGSASGASKPSSSAAYDRARYDATASVTVTANAAHPASYIAAPTNSQQPCHTTAAASSAITKQQYADTHAAVVSHASSSHAQSGSQPGVQTQSAAIHEQQQQVSQSKAAAQTVPPTTAAPQTTPQTATATQEARSSDPAESSTNPLHMFASLASRRVPIYPPRLPHPTDDATLLSGHINVDHTAALPGYAVGKVIGEGGFCQVRLAVHKLSGRRVAVKIIDKLKLADAAEARRIQREIRVMRHLSHECIIKLLEVVDGATTLYLVMEHAPCGSLLDYVRSKKRLSEGDAVLVTQQIVAGLAHCHRREVVHRDIKLENILMDANNTMKLIDFGLSAFFIPGKQLRVHCGSPSYAAPEIVSRKHYDGPPVDVWSLGVVLFAMLAGHLPFHSSQGNKQELCAKIMEGKYNCPDYISAPAKDLLSRMLCVDPGKRITLDQVMQHPWITGGGKWESIGASVYMVRVDPAGGLVYADEQLVEELEAAGYSRAQILQYLLNGEANYLTTAYFLLAEGKAEVIKRMRGLTAAQRYIARAAPSNHHHSSSHNAGESSPTNHSPVPLSCNPGGVGAGSIKISGGIDHGKPALTGHVPTPADRIITTGMQQRQSIPVG